MKSASISLKGDAQTIRVLNTLPKKIYKRVVQQAVRASAKPTVVAARRNLTKGHGVRTGALKKSLGTVLRTYRSRGVVLAVVGARRGMSGNKIEPANYAHLVEFGHAIPSGGSVAPRPFMRHAWEATKNGALSAMMAKIRDGVQREASKR